MEEWELFSDKPEQKPVSQGKYFKESLSNFVHDTASGAAIRHLVDRGYSISRISEEPDYPAPMERLKETVWKYMLESKIIIFFESPFNPSGQAEALCFEPQAKLSGFHAEALCFKPQAKLSGKLRKVIEKYSEDRVYLHCPLKKWLGEVGKSGIIFKCPTLTAREQDYLWEIPWENARLTESSSTIKMPVDKDIPAVKMPVKGDFPAVKIPSDGNIPAGVEFYHKLNSRMFEIAVELAAFGESLEILAFSGKEF